MRRPWSLFKKEKLQEELKEIKASLKEEKPKASFKIRPPSKIYSKNNIKI